MPMPRPQEKTSIHHHHHHPLNPHGQHQPHPAPDIDPIHSSSSPLQSQPSSSPSPSPSASYPNSASSLAYSSPDSPSYTPTRNPSISSNATHHHHHHSFNPQSIPTTIKPSLPSSSTLDNDSEPSPVGLQADDVYRSQMAPWQFAVRSILLASLNREIELLKWIQIKSRSPSVDRLMTYSSWLGSHQFFILTLPLILWIGDHHFGRSQVYILAISVYFTSALKDLVCIPRPYSPPIERLSISTHAAEYGFPSTHSATSVSTIVLIFQLVLRIQSPIYQIGLLISLTLYGFLLIFGRVYCGMHSIQDVVCGCLIGILSWSIHHTFAPSVEAWLTNPQSGSNALPVPIILIILGLIFTAAHPQPVEDCPCFEDSTAFVAVFVGVMIGHRFANDLILGQLNDRSSGLRFPQSTIKVLLGLSIIFGWRFLMKELLSRLLPPLFRFFAPLLELPRRHHLPTKDYNKYRDELRERRRRIGLRARLIPSVVHLPTITTDTTITTTTTTTTPRNTNNTTPLRNRFPTTPVTNAPAPPATGSDHAPQDTHPPESDPSTQELKSLNLTLKQTLPNHNLTTTTTTTTTTSKRYDVDVLMRLIVYCGIGLLSRFDTLFSLSIPPSLLCS